MSLLECDECKKTLKEPIFMPCGYSICKSHIDESTCQISPCRFCKNLHQESFVVNEKVSRLLKILNRTKESLNKLSDKTQAYERLKESPLDFVNSRFDELKRQVKQERDKIVEFISVQVDLEANKFVNEIEMHRERCLKRLKMNPPTAVDLGYINTKLADINEFLFSNKISEDIWDEINEQTSLMYEKVTAKMNDLHEVLMDKAVYRFEPVFDYTKKIGLGKLMVKANGVQNETVSSIKARKSTYKKQNGQNKSQPMRRFKRTLGHINCVYCICFDRTGEYIFTGSDDKLVKMWRAKDGMLVYTLRGHTKEIGDLDINYENTILASGGNDKKVMCWNVKTAQLIYINTHILNVSTVKFSPYCQDNNRWLISTGNDGFIFFIKYSYNPDSTNSYDFDKPIKFQVESKVFCSSFSTGGNFLAIGTKEKQIYLYYIQKTQPILVTKFPGHHMEVNSINFANKSLCLLSGSNDGTAKVWQIKEKKFTSSQLIELESHCTDAIWNCDDSLVITAQRANSRVVNPCIKIWTPSGALKNVLNFHKRIIFNIKPHPTDPKLLLSASLDGYVVIWDIFTGQRLFTDYNEMSNEVKHGSICNAKWSPNKGQLFASSDSHGHLSIFGFGSSTPDSYSSTPTQLFFHTDYDPLCKSKELNTMIDKRTKIPPNFMPYGYLTDYMINPLPLKAQRLVPTHENLTKEEFNKLLVPKPNGTQGQLVIDDRLSEIDFVSDNLSHKNLIQPLSEAILRESETFRLEYSAKEEEIFMAEFSDNLKEGETNANKRRERVDSNEIDLIIDELYSSSSSLDSISTPRKRMKDYLKN